MAMFSMDELLDMRQDLVGVIGFDI